jgi:hypothetical protein
MTRRRSQGRFTEPSSCREALTEWGAVCGPRSRVGVEARTEYAPGHRTLTLECRRITILGIYIQLWTAP